MKPLASRWRLAALFVLALAAGLLLALPALASATTYTVDNLGDEYSPSGCVGAEPCSLRTAIVKANANEGTDTIEFSVEGTIHVEPEMLPPISDPVIIDATTLPAYKGAPLVELDGTAAQAEEGGTEGLALLGGSGGSRIEGLAIGGFTYGVRIAGESPSQLCASYVGVELDGTTALPNFDGVLVDGEGVEAGANCSAHGGNLISGNNAYGIVDAGKFTAITRNRIGVDATGAPLPNGPEGGVGAGILVGSAAKDPVIGGLPGEGGVLGNEIAFNNGYGILVEAGESNVEMRSNSIHGDTVGAIEVVLPPRTPAPALETSAVELGTGTVLGTLEAAANEGYEVDVFASRSCYPSRAGEAERYIGTIFVDTNASGDATVFSDELEEPPNGYEYFTATATPEGTRATSRLSLCQDQPPGVAVGSVPNGISSSSEGTFEFIGLDANGKVSSFECRIDGGPFETCDSPQTYSGLDDGNHRFELRAIDQVGTVQPSPFSYEWNVDTTYPSEAIEAAPANPTNQTGAEFQFTTSDGAEGSGVRKVECRIDGGQPGPCTSPQSYAGLADGTHEFQVLATDWAGHTSFDPYVWTIDTGAPTAAIESKPPSISGSASPTFSFRGDDGSGTGVARFECSLDGAEFTTCTSPSTYPGLSEGSHSFEVQAVDAAGKTSDPASYSWTVDTVQPLITLESTPANPANQQFATIEFSASDPGGSGVATTKCRFDGTVLITCTSPDSISPLADGSHVFEMVATDKAGNSKSKTYEWTVDATPPATTIDSQPANPSSEANPSFTFNGDDGSGSGVARFECSLDGAAFGTCTSPQSYSGLPDGPHSFEVRAVDNAGNADASPAAAAWTIDTTGPEAMIESEPASLTNNGDPNFTFGGDDTAAGFECSLDGAPFGACTSPRVYDGLEDGPHSFEVEALDAVGNAGPPAAYSWTVDSTLPTTAIESQPASSSGSGAASFEFSGGDANGSGVTGFECSLDKAPFAPCTSPQDYSGLAEGPHTFEVRAVDAAGNTAMPVSYSWTVDRSRPSSSSLASDAAQGSQTPAPKNGDSVAVAPEGGRVFVQRPGQKKPTELKEGETIPVGSLVDATQGKVLLTSVNANGEAQSAYFFGGKFLVTQHEGNGLVVLKLRGALGCASAAREPGLTATASGKSGRHLWGSGHGNFRTEGSSGSATVRGTIWLTEDRCDGSTFFKVRRGVVSVRDFTTNKTISLPAGNSYTAGP